MHQRRERSTCKRTGVRISAIAAALAGVPMARGDGTKADRILAGHGLQVWGWVASDSALDLSVFRNAGYTGVQWQDSSDTSKQGPAPGIIWSRVAGDPSQ